MKVAALANLELTDAEVETYRGQLDDILTYIDKLNEIDISNIEPMTQVVAAASASLVIWHDLYVSRLLACRAKTLEREKRSMLPRENCSNPGANPMFDRNPP